MGNIEEEKQWYVLQVAHNGALKAQTLFADLGVESFVPMEMKHVKVKGGKVVKKLVPIFFNLIFVDITYSRLKEIKAVNSSLWYLSSRLSGKHEPMIIPRGQMQAFIDFVDGNYEEVEYIDANSFNIKKGERVRITEGAFQGKEATFVKITGKRKFQIVVAIEGLLAVTIMHKNPSHIVERIK